MSHVRSHAIAADFPGIRDLRLWRPGARADEAARMPSNERKERMPATDRLRRLLPLSGVVFSAILAVGLALTAGEPDNSGSKADIYAYWHSHHGVQLISSL